MKKIISILLCLSLMLSSFMVVNAEDKVSEKVIESLETLQALGFVNTDYDAESFTFDAFVSRGDFAYNLGNILNIGNEKGENLYFHDVSKDYYAYNQITFLVEHGGIDGKGEKLFKPEETITVNEAAKMIIGAMDYSFLVDAYGGYPDGVTRAAYRLGLFDSMNSVNGNLTYGEMFQMLYNAITMETLSIKSVVGTDIQFETKGQTFLSEQLDIYIEKGYVNGFDGADITSVKSEKDEVVINQTVFNANGIDCSAFIGSEVKYIYQHDVENDEYKLIKIDLTGKSKALVLTLYEHEYSFDPVTYQMFYNNGSSEKYLNISRGADVVYNGRLVNEGIDDILSLKADTLRLVNTNSDKYYEIVVVEDYETILISMVSEAEYAMYGKNGKSINLKDVEDVYVFNQGGAEIEFDTIPEGAVASVYKSLDNSIARVYLSTKTIEGKYVAMEEMSGYYLIGVDEDVYICNSKFDVAEFNMSANVIVYFDHNGKVATMEYAAANGVYGFLVDISLKHEAFNESTMYVKIFGKDGKMHILQCDERLTIDNVRFKQDAEAVFATLGGNEFESQLIRYNVNDENFLTMIDTIIPDDVSSFRESHKYMLRQYKNSKFISNSAEGSMMVSAATTIFNIPESPKIAEDDEFEIIKVSSITDWRNMNCSGYVDTEDTLICNALVTFANNTGNLSSTRYLMVNRVYQKVDSDGEPVYAIEGYYGNNEFTVLCDDNYDPTELGKGDIIYLTYNMQGRVVDAALNYSPGNIDIPFTYDHANLYIITGGYVHSAQDNIMAICKENGSDNYEDIYKVGTVWIYDAERNTITKGTPADAKTVRNSGNGDFVVVYTVQGYVQATYLYKQ